MILICDNCGNPAPDRTPHGSDCTCGGNYDMLISGSMYAVTVADVHGNGQFSQWSKQYTSKEEAEADGWAFAKDVWPYNQCGVCVSPISVI